MVVSGIDDFDCYDIRCVYNPIKTALSPTPITFSVFQLQESVYPNVPDEFFCQK